MKDKRVRISQCMIVKNEEKNIRKALSWGKGIVFEQIVVDTGSTDRTVEIARSMGAKVYHFEWIQDFSAAKNFALEKAKGDWIAFLDADEYLEKEWAKKLPSLIRRLHKTNCIVVRSPLVSIDDNGEIMSVARQWRFFRWLPELRYQNAIHEVLRFQGLMIPDATVWDTEDEFPIYHTGYAASVSAEKNKKERNLTLLEKNLEQNPEDYNTMGYMGDTYKSEGENEEAEKWFRKAIAAMPEKTDFRDERSALTYVYLLIILGERNDMDAFMEIYDKAKAYLPWVYDMDYVAGKFLNAQGAYEKALYHQEQALAVIDQYGENAYGIYLQANIGEFWEDMAWCCYKTGRLQECVERCVSLLKEDKKRIRALAILLKVLENESPEAIVRFLGNIYFFEEPSDRIIILRGAVQAGAVEFLKLFKAFCTAEEQEAVEKAEQAME